MLEKSEVMQPMNVKLPLEVRKQIQERADKLSASKSYVIRELLKKSLEVA
jgi:predicted DNA-binding protein